MYKMPQKDLTMLNGWEVYSEQLQIEYQQSLEEGKDVTAFKPLIDAISNLPLTNEKEALGETVFALITGSSQKSDYPFEEPDDLSRIRELRDGFLISSKELTKDQIKDKLTGAWAGRVCGCMLGKPAEGIHTPDIREFFRKTDNWPIRRYALSTDMLPELEGNALYQRLKETGWFPDTISYAPSDDDTNYTVLASAVIDRYGRNFTPGDMMESWLTLQPKTAYCTAERVAMRNFSLGYFPPDSARYKNPYREWIGAQIRGDYFGYINPGDPETAAEMAWRDASISHVKNGIYGEMFVAAMLAAATVSQDISEVIRVGLSQIPKTSRLYAACTKVVKDWQQGLSEDDFFANLHQRWDECDPHHWCHTISNAEIVTAVLLYEKDYAGVIGRAVMEGFDTDCNAATAGSVFGMLHGASAISKAWTAPIGGTVDTTIVGIGTTTVDGLVEKMLGHLTPTYNLK